MSDQLLDQIADRSQMQSDKDFVDKILDDIFAKFQTISDLKISLGTDNTFAKASDTMGKIKKQQDDLSLSVSAYNKLLDDQAQKSAKLSANTSQAAQDNANLNTQLKESNKQLQLSAQYQNAANGSIDQAKAFVAALVEQRNKLDLSNQEGKDSAFELNQEIDRQNAFIKVNVSALEKQKIEIGNYTGAVDLLRGHLGQITATLETMRIQGQENTDQFALAQKEFTLLTQVLDKADKGFSNVSRELRTMQQTLQALRVAGLQDTEVFKQLRDSVNKTQDEFNDFAEAQKRLAQSPFEASIQSSVEALQGLAGIYGAAVSAQQLFGKENDELTKSMQKLQAVLVLLTSLQQVSTTIGKSEAIVDGIQAGARGLLAGVTTVYTFVTEAATAATFAFRAALAVTGIGGLLLLLASFVNELIKISNGLEAATERQIKYNEALKDFYDALKDGNEEYLKYIGYTKDALERQLELLQAEGAQYRNLQAIKTQIAQEDQKNAVAGLKNLGLSNDTIDDQGLALEDARKSVESLRDEYDRLGDELRAYEDIRAKAAKDAVAHGDNPDDDRAVKAAKAHIDSLKASRDAITAQLEPGEKLIKQYDEADQAIKVLTAETAKYNKEQASNDTLSQRLKLSQDIIEVNKKILDNDKSTESEKLSALNRITEAQLAQNEAQLKHDNGQTGLSDEQKAINIRNAAQNDNKIKLEADKEYLSITHKYDEDAYQFNLTILKQEAQDSIAKDKAILDNQKATKDQQLAANTDLYNKQRAIAVADLFNTLHDKTTTDEQRKAAEAKFNSEILQLDLDFNTNRRKINADAAQKLLQDGIRSQGQIVLSAKQQYNEAIKSLQGERESGHLTDSEYSRKAQSLADEQATKEAQSAVTVALMKVHSTKEGTDERLAAETDLADKVKALNDQELKDFTDKEKAKQEAAQETVDKIGQYYDGITTVVGQALDSQITAEKNQLQDQLNNLQTRKDAEVDTENNSLDLAQDKAAKIATINANAQAQSEALQRKQKQLDIQKAQFDKIKGVGEIILNTAKAVTADLTNPAKIPFDIALGAAELSIAIAAPVPTYALGTPLAGHAGGPMIVGDGGKSELVELPGGRMYITPRTDTYIPDAPAGTIVYPDAERYMRNNPEKFIASAGGSQASAMDSWAIQQGLSRVVSAIEAKEELHVSMDYMGIMAAHKYGNSWLEYVRENTQF